MRANTLNSRPHSRTSLACTPAVADQPDMADRVDPDIQAKINTPTSVPTQAWNKVRQITSKTCYAGGLSKKEYMVQTIEVRQHDENEP